MPKVSVLTPLYNTKEEYLRAAIESILNQTYTDFEFLLLNDSPGNKELEKIVKSYNDKRIIYLENEKNIGISNSRNKLLEVAKGEYLAIFDHDDVSMPERLKKEVRYLDENKDVGVVSCNFMWMSNKKNSNFPTENIDIKKALPKFCALLHTGSMIRKSVLVDNGIRYEQDYSPCEDFLLWTRLMNKTMFHNLPEILIHYRDFDNTTHRVVSKMEEMTYRITNIIYKENPYLLTLDQVKQEAMDKTSFMEKIFSIRNECKCGVKRKIITVCGVKIKLRSKIFFTKKYDLVVSIGEACSCATNLKINHLRKFSGPFDWLYGANLTKRIDYLLSDFEACFNREDFEFIDNGYRLADIYVNKKTGIVYNHDFPKGEQFSKVFPKVKEKYQRRISRVLSALKNDKQVLLVYLELPNVAGFESRGIGTNEIIACAKKLSNKYPNVDLLYIRHNETLKDKTNLCYRLRENLVIAECFNYERNNIQADGSNTNLRNVKTILQKIKLKGYWKNRIRRGK